MEDPGLLNPSHESHPCSQGRLLRPFLRLMMSRGIKGQATLHVVQAVVEMLRTKEAVKEKRAPRSKGRGHP